MRLMALLVMALLTVGGPAQVRSTVRASAGSAVTPPISTPRYVVPLGGVIRVVRPFEAPKTRYGAGHRGVDLASTEGEATLAAGGGMVTFAGTIAGRGIVVIAHPDGIRTEYEPVTPSVHVGEVVALGQRIGSVHGVHATCGVGGCLHWGARRGDVYFDPFGLLAQLGVVRLLPMRPSGAGMGLGVGLP